MWRDSIVKLSRRFPEQRSAADSRHVDATVRGQEIPWFENVSPQRNIASHSSLPGDARLPDSAKDLISSGLLRALEKSFTIDITEN